MRTTCEKGHIYNSDEYKAGCPYCNPDFKRIDFSMGAGNSIGGGTVKPGYSYEDDDWKTARVGMDMNDDGKTVRPNMMRNDDDKTVRPNMTPSFDDSKTVAPTDDNKTVIRRNSKAANGPVTGWLACIDGTLAGKSFELYDKVNRIGRDSSMDVCLKDETISRIDHARIGYDSRHQKYTLIPDKNASNIYLNDEAIYVPMEVKAYDCLEFGECKFVFIPLCGPRFTWEKGLI